MKWDFLNIHHLHTQDRVFYKHGPLVFVFIYVIKSSFFIFVSGYMVFVFHVKR
jgi:hypothetical protein